MSDNCKAEMMSAYGDTMSEEDIDAILQELRDAREYALEDATGPTPDEAVRLRSEELTKKMEEAKSFELAAVFRNAIVDNEAMGQIDRAVVAGKRGKKSIVSGFHSLIHGVHKSFTGAMRSAESMQMQNQAEMWRNFENQLRRDGVFHQFQGMKSGSELELDVAKASKHLNTKDAKGPPPGSPDAVKIAKATLALLEDGRLRQNELEAHIGKLDGRIARQTHDRDVMRRHGEEAWIREVANRMDWKEMKIPDARRGEFMSSLYKNLRTGQREKDRVKGGVATSFKGPGNLAKSISQSRSIVFKTAEDWLEYNKIYGTGSLRESVMQEMHQASRNIGVLKQFGTNPEAMLDRLINKAKDKYKHTDMEAMEYLDASEQSIKDRMDALTGAINIGADTKVAKIGEGVRALKTMALLGKSTVAALSDGALMQITRQYHGRSIFQSWGDSFNATYTASLMAMGAKQRTRVGTQLLVGLETTIGTSMARLSSDDYLPGNVNGMLNAYFKFNRLGPWTDGMKEANTKMLSRDLVEESGKSFDDLSPAIKRLMDVYGIGAKQWDSIRASAKEADDGRTYIMPGDVADREAASNLGMMYVSEADHAVVTPGVREQHLMKMGTTPDTPHGQAMRMLMQFKGHPLSAITKIGGRAVESGTRMQQVNLLIGAMLAGVAIVQLKEIIVGREPLEFDLDLLKRGFVQGGAGGLYADLLFGSDYSEFGTSVISDNMGPVFGDVEKMGRLIWSAAKGDVDGKGTLNFVRGYIPGQNIPLIKEALDFAIFYQLQELINPGYTKRTVQNQKNRTGQDPWFDHSNYIATGGGFK